MGAVGIEIIVANSCIPSPLVDLLIPSVIAVAEARGALVTRGQISLNYCFFGLLGLAILNVALRSPTIP